MAHNESKKAQAKALRKQHPNMSNRAIADRLSVSPSSVGAWLNEPEGESATQDLAGRSSPTEDEVASLLLEKAKEIAELLPSGLNDKDGVPMVQQGASAVARLVEKYLALTGRPGDGPNAPPKAGEAKELEQVLDRFFTKTEQ